MMQITNGDGSAEYGRKPVCCKDGEGLAVLIIGEGTKMNGGQWLMAVMEMDRVSRLASITDEE